MALELTQGSFLNTQHSQMMVMHFETDDEQTSR
jgi:hypothetical protein